MSELAIDSTLSLPGNTNLSKPVPCEICRGIAESAGYSQAEVKIACIVVPDENWLCPRCGERCEAVRGKSRA